MKFIVAQIGARHHYAIPRMLARGHHLEALYTDSCANRGLGRVLSLMIPQTLRTGRTEKLSQRQIVGVPDELIRSTDRLVGRGLFTPANRDVRDDIERMGAEFSRQMIRWGTGNATHVYSMFGEGIEFLRFAKERGLRICVDVFLTPVAHRIIAEERSRFPEWEGDASPWDERLEPRIREIIELADLLLCPGENVVEGLIEFGNQSTSKCRVVPYGSGVNFGGRVNEPVVGRVLFAGTAELRKGIHYFAAAAGLLGTPGYEFRVVGGVTDRIRQLSACSSLNFLGRVSRGEMVNELLLADVLVLPTLAEGSASVISEALAAGLPVITTRSAGSVVAHERSGLLVPEREVEALAFAIKTVVADRARRDALASGALNISRILSETSWTERLLAAIGS